MKYILIIDNIRSTHNVGSLLRTADGAGVDKVYLCGTTPTPVDRFGRAREAVSKVSLGAEEYLDWEYRDSTTELVKALQEQGVEVLALEQAEDSILYYDYKPTESSGVALVVGNEVDGVSKEALTLADTILEIPMHGQKESLNVSVAGGVALFALVQIFNKPPK